MQSEGLYTSYVGFDRSLLYFLLKWAMQVIFAAILVFLDIDLAVFLLVSLLFLIYFGLQLGKIRAKTSSSEWLTFLIFSLLLYTTTLLYIEPNNYLGWFCILLLITLISFTSIKYLRYAAKVCK